MRCSFTIPPHHPFFCFRSWARPLNFSMHPYTDAYQVPPSLHPDLLNSHRASLFSPSPHFLLKLVVSVVTHASLPNAGPLVLILRGCTVRSTFPRSDSRHHTLAYCSVFPFPHVGSSFSPFQLFLWLRCLRLYSTL